MCVGYNRQEIEYSLAEAKYDDVFATYLLLGRKSTDVSTKVIIVPLTSSDGVYSFLYVGNPFKIYVSFSCGNNVLLFLRVTCYRSVYMLVILEFVFVKCGNTVLWFFEGFVFVFFFRI